MGCADVSKNEQCCQLLLQAEMCGQLGGNTNNQIVHTEVLSLLYANVY